ncbi:MAG: hypothetical protein HY231_05880 [Acidobacteria bacterium]|nr:hypothetical protein [Acidobacteriota bacterium]
MNDTTDKLLSAIKILLYVFLSSLVILIGVRLLENDQAENVGFAFLYFVFGILVLFAFGGLIFVGLLYYFNWREYRPADPPESGAFNRAGQWPPHDETAISYQQSGGTFRRQTEAFDSQTTKKKKKRGNTDPLPEVLTNRPPLQEEPLSKQPLQDAAKTPTPFHGTGTTQRLYQKAVNQSQSLQDPTPSHTPLQIEAILKQATQAILNQRQALQEDATTPPPLHEAPINTPLRHEEPPPQKPSAKPSHAADLEIFQVLYNQAADDASLRQAFREQYAPIRFGTHNALQRHKDSSLEPIFQSATDGDYYAVKLGNVSPNQYVVVPRFDLTFRQSCFGPDAMGEVFYCPDYDPRLRYRRVRVPQAAIFESSDKQTWKFVRLGQLQLGQGE